MKHWNDCTDEEQNKRLDVVRVVLFFMPVVVFCFVLFAGVALNSR